MGKIAQGFQPALAQGKRSFGDFQIALAAGDHQLFRALVEILIAVHGLKFVELLAGFDQAAFGSGKGDLGFAFFLGNFALLEMTQGSLRFRQRGLRFLKTSFGREDLARGFHLSDLQLTAGGFDLERQFFGRRLLLFLGRHLRLGLLHRFCRLPEQGLL